MKERAVPERLTTHSHQLTQWGSLLLILAVFLRRRYDLENGFNLGFALILLGSFTLLFTTEGLVAKRVKAYPRIYFIVQILLAQVLGVFQSYQDTWALLYVALSFQVAWRCSRREAWFWFGLMTASLLVTMGIEFGFVSGAGRALAYIMIGTLVSSFDHQYSQHQDALEESQVLLAELQEANRKLIDHAAQAEKLAAIQERDRMVQELYDSVGQKIFAIQLAAETTRLMLEKDPLRTAVQVDELQQQTRSALAQMRQLIGQWRPG